MALAFANCVGTVGTVAGTTFTQSVVTPLINDWLFALVFGTSFNAGIYTMTNNAGQNWQKIVPEATDGSAMHWAMFATKLGASPSGTCAGTDNQTCKHTIHVMRFTGADNNGVGDGTPNIVSSGGSSVTVKATGNTFTSNTNDIIIGFSARTASTTQAWTAPGGAWNVGLSSAIGASSNIILWSGYQIVSAPQSSGIAFPGATTAVTTPQLLSGIIGMVGITDLAPTQLSKPTPLPFMATGSTGRI